jgi:hypothetical protein
MKIFSQNFVSLIVVSLLLTRPAYASPSIGSSVECMGPPAAKGYAIYLHGLESPDAPSEEEKRNRQVLATLGQDFAWRIALPRGALCPSGRLCWPAKDRDQVLKTFQTVQQDAQACWKGQPQYSLIGFSNGGYFALKLYKLHKDPLLHQIIASGSAGTWEKKADRPNPFSSFHLMIGSQDITLKQASRLAEALRQSLPSFTFEKFQGGHRLDLATLTRFLDMSKKTPPE